MHACVLGSLVGPNDEQTIRNLLQNNQVYTKALDFLDMNAA